MQPKALIHAFHRGELELDDAALDAALGLPPQRWVPDVERDTQLSVAHPGESIVNVATPYEVCRNLVDALDLTADDRFVDLGCGMGRILLYAALLTPARFRGVEMVEDRVTAARRAVAHLGLGDRVSLTHGNALDDPLDDGTVYFMFRPFSVETEATVLGTLHEQARRRDLTLVTHRIQPSSIDRSVFDCVSLSTPQVYRARR